MQRREERRRCREQKREEERRGEERRGENRREERGWIEESHQIPEQQEPDAAQRGGESVEPAAAESSVILLTPPLRPY